MAGSEFLPGLILVRGEAVTRREAMAVAAARARDAGSEAELLPRAALDEEGFAAFGFAGSSKKKRVQERKNVSQDNHLKLNCLNLPDLTIADSGFAGKPAGKARLGDATLTGVGRGVEGDAGAGEAAAVAAFLAFQASSFSRLIRNFSSSSMDVLVALFATDGEAGSEAVEPFPLAGVTAATPAEKVEAKAGFLIGGGGRGESTGAGERRFSGEREGESLSSDLCCPPPSLLSPSLSG